ncbi:MAG TPA: MarP family serine protease [Solirubrobacteraceae bacterium]|jgi:S1-C subfamily serine protease|nr:MarP family serine protease [Solirubrobacteraceae bacterium]
MTTLDWVILAATALFAISGYLRGFIAGVLSLAGFVLGAIVGTRIADALLASGASSPYAPVFGLVGALGLGAILAFGLEGVGLRLRRSLRLPFLGMLDGVLGAILSATVALAIAWIAGIVVLALPGGGGQLAASVRHSQILRQLDELMPPSGVVLNALARIDPLPAIAAGSAAVAPPPSSVAGQAALARAGRSVVRVVGSACGLGIEGSGWVIAPGVVVTNAHVVAGETDTQVEAGGTPPALHATVVRFDPRNDIAILRVAALRVPSLRLAGDAHSQTPGAIAGYPLDGPLRLEPARVGVTAYINTQDAYGRGPVSRRLTAVRGLIRPGNSGGPVLSRAGSVLTTVFAATTSGGPAGGFGVANSTVRADLALARGAVSTQGCTG